MILKKDQIKQKIKKYLSKHKKSFEFASAEIDSPNEVI